MQKPIKHHGVHKLELKEKKLILNKTNKNDIIKILGKNCIEIVKAEDFKQGKTK